MKKNFLKGLIEKSADGRTYRVIASTSTPDRQGDSVDQKGWETENFMRNPVMPWAHDYKGLPVAKVLNLTMEENRMIAEYEFATEEMNPFAAQVKALVDGGFLNAVSVGFIAKERSGNVITKSELLEISFVPVPANQEALMLSYKELGISDELMATMKTCKGVGMCEDGDCDHKGEVEDEIAARDAWEAKWNKWEEVGEVMGAFWNVYFNEETPVEDFEKLLREAIVLLQDVAGEAEVEATEDEKTAIKAKFMGVNTPELRAKFVSEFIAKEGRTLSKNTLKKIETALEAGKSLITVLEELKASSTDGDGEEEKEVAPIVATLDADELAKEAEAAMATVRSILRGNDRSTEAALGVITRFLDKRK